MKGAFLKNIFLGFVFLLTLNSIEAQAGMCAASKKNFKQAGCYFPIAVPASYGGGTCDAGPNAITTEGEDVSTCSKCLATVVPCATYRAGVTCYGVWFKPSTTTPITPVQVQSAKNC